MTETRRSLTGSADDAEELLKKYGLRPNKALGQNFLRDGEAIGRIVAHLRPEGRNILEIGPGLGAITREICKRADRVLAVEIDASMASVLASELSEFPNLTVLCSDFLKTDKSMLQETLGANFSVAGNLPYYITTPIVMDLLAFCPAAEQMILTVQAEAAQRFFARPKDRVYGPLTVLSQTAYDINLVMRLPPSCFFPAPEVNSSVVELVRKPENNIDMRAFTEMLQAAFSMRRKTLANNLGAKNMLSREDTAKHLQKMGLPADARAESLSPSQLADFAVHAGLLKL